MVRSRMVELALIGFCLAVPFQGQETKNSGPSAQARAEMKKSELPLSSLTEFSAIMVGSLVGNIDELHVYRSGNLMRTEMLDGNYMVTNLDSRDTFGVLPDRCVHSAVPSVNTFPFSFFRPGQKAERNLVGSEVVDGHACQVEEITITPEQGQPRKMKFWEATDLSGFPVKIEVQRVMGAPVTITYKDVKIGRPDPALFQHPSNCKLSQQPGVKGAVKLSAPKPPEKSQR